MTGDPGEPARHRRVTRSFVAVIVVAFAVTTLLAYDIHQNRQAIRVMAADQRAFDRFRAERAKRTTSADRLICLAVNGLKKAERDRDIRDFRNLDRNLRLLHIRKTPEIVRAATHDYHENLRRTKPLKCNRLPTAKGGATPPTP